VIDVDYAVEKRRGQHGGIEAAPIPLVAFGKGFPPRITSDADGFIAQATDSGNFDFSTCARPMMFPPAV
jgi:hypothetical protein